jgi:4-oxalocrotonate tautomerase
MRHGGDGQTRAAPEGLRNATKGRPARRAQRQAFCPSRLRRAAAGRSRARKHGSEIRGEDAMPHVIVKLWPGKSEQQKKKLAGKLTNAVMSTLNYGEESVSVGIEEVKPQDWTDQVYKPDILGKRETIYKEPGYEP